MVIPKSRARRKDLPGALLSSLRIQRFPFHRRPSTCQNEAVEALSVLGV